MCLIRRIEGLSISNNIEEVVVLFEIIDHKGQCKSIFTEGSLISDPISILEKNSNDLQTWNYHPRINDLNVDYGYIISHGMTLDQACPDFLKDDWDKIKEKYLAFERSFKEGKVDRGDTCFYDLVPINFITDFFGLRSQITDHIISNNKKPQNYNFLVDLTKFTYKIAQQKLNIDFSVLKSNQHRNKVKAFLRKIERCEPRINYDIFGAVTGRLTTRKKSFPILNLDKKYRDILKPHNDYFIDLDINGAELRTMIALNGETQPKEDIHDWHKKQFERSYGTGNMTREDAKVRVLKWLYGTNNDAIGIPSIDAAYDKEKLREKFWDGYYVETPFGRRIPSDKFHSLNRIIQTSSNDIFLRQVLKIDKMLEGRKSFVSWGIHDSATIDFAHEDKDLFPNLVQAFGETKFGFFRVNLKLGNSYGKMKEFHHEAAYIR